jgi:hypothetical protein
MSIFSFPTISLTLFTLFTIYVTRRIYHTLTTRSRLRTLAAHYACLPCPHLPTYLFGLDTLIALNRSYTSQTFLSTWTQKLRRTNAHTVSVTLLGNTVYVTDDPANMKTMLATGFSEWSLGAGRIQEMGSWLGEGVFTNEGSRWKKSREMLRPCFEKCAVADVSLFEKHFDRLAALLPTDGTTVDLQLLLFKYALDVATEFLFGKSTGSLLGEGMGQQGGMRKEEVEKFVEAFEYCGNPMLNENYKRWGYVGLLMRDGKRKESARVIRGKVSPPCFGCLGADREM